MSREETSPATERDVEIGKAVFWVPEGRSKIYDLGVRLPAMARVRKAIEFSAGDALPVGTTVQIVQAEIVDEKDVLVGFVHSERKGVCALEEIEVLQCNQKEP